MKMTAAAPELAAAKKNNTNVVSSRRAEDILQGALEMIKEEEEEATGEAAVGGDQQKGPTTTKMKESTKITGKKRDWESGLKKVRSMVVHPINVLEAKYVQLMTDFAGRVGTRTSPRLSSPRAVPDWQL